MNNKKIKEMRDKIIKDYNVPCYHVGVELEPGLKTEIKRLIANLRIRLKLNIIIVKLKIKYYFINLFNKLTIFKERNKK